MKAGVARPSLVSILTVAGECHEERVTEPRALPDLGRDYPSMPDNPMSRRMTSGRSPIATLTADGPSWATETRCPEILKELSDALRRVNVVVDDEDPAQCVLENPRWRLGRAFLAHLRVAERCQTDDELAFPWLSPALRASTLLPWSSTSVRTTVRPMPSPP